MNRLATILLLCSWPALAAPNDLVGVAGGFHPFDSTETHDLLRTMNPAYVVYDIAYAWWTNGTSSSTWNAAHSPTGGLAFYDQFYTLNSNYMMIVTFSDVPTNLISTWLPEITNRYPLIWAYQPAAEVESVSDAVNKINLFRTALPDKRLAGPGFPNSYSPVYVDAIVASNAFQKLDVFIMHDYFACPGNGGAVTWPWTGVAYTHPIDPVDVTIPSLAGRLAWMNTYTNLLRTNLPGWPKVMLSEYGVFASNTADAYVAASTSRRYRVPFLATVPNSPANQTNSFPYGNSVSNGLSYVFTEAFQAFLKLPGMYVNAVNLLR